MKTSKVYNHGTLVQTDENLRAYAKYLCKYVEAYQKEGISIRQLHVQNEPVSDQKFPSCVWTGEEFKRFIGQYLGPMIEKERLDVKIWLGTLNGPETDERAPYTRYNDYANLVLHDQDAYSYIEGISYQWAGKYAVQVTKQAFPEKKMIQSENECGDGKNTWEYANYVFELLHHYITNGVNAYVYWNMILMPEGRSTWGWKQNSLVTINEHEIVYNYEYYVMKHFSRYIKKGAKRLELRGHISGNSVGFKNSDGTRVYVIQNPFKKALKVTLGSEVIYLPAESINTVLL